MTNLPLSPVDQCRAALRRLADGGSCTPPDLNEGSKVAPSGFSDPGVCIPSKNPLGSLNRDSTGLRYVRKGCVVQFPGGATCRVARVRTGLFWADIPIPSRMPSHFCSCVTVLHG